MPVILKSNNDDSTGGIVLGPQAFARLVQGKTVKSIEYNDDGGRLNWFTINLSDGTWVTVHHLSEGAGFVHTRPT
jgi:hypothetical protein